METTCSASGARGTASLINRGRCIIYVSMHYGPVNPKTLNPRPSKLGGRIGGTLGDIYPVKKVPFQRAKSRVKKGPL